jgi:hypothetical protein
MLDDMLGRFWYRPRVGFLPLRALTAALPVLPAGGARG